MKGRKPKYPQELINELAARQADGESASALAREKNMKRTSVIRCKDSARLPAEIKSKALGAAAQTGTVKQCEKLFWKFLDALLRQGIEIAPDFTPKDMAVMFEAAAKLKTILTSSRSGRSLPESQKTEETMMIFRRHFKQPDTGPIEAKPVEESSERVLGGHKGDASESVSDGEPASEAGQSGEANGAT